MPARAIVAACDLFGIDSNRARVTIARLVAQGRLERAGRGAYALTRAAETVNRNVRTWPEIGQLQRPWTGDWMIVHMKHRPSSRDRESTARAIRFARMIEAAPTVAVRPDNLHVSDFELRETLVGMGLRVPFFITRGTVDASASLEFATKWPVDALRAEYARLTARLEASLARLNKIPFKDALVETFTLGGEAVRALVLDPLLPDVMMPPYERNLLLEMMKQYDRMGRTMWRRFMAPLASPETSDFAPIETAAFAAGEPAHLQREE